MTLTTSTPPFVGGTTTATGPTEVALTAWSAGDVPHVARIVVMNAATPPGSE